jgi:NADH:ubiquinone oxidoreductase subunit 2 (subunit N)
MSIAGIPPFNGFWSKLIIVLACVEAGHYGFALVAVLMSLVTLSFQLKVQKYAFFESAKAALSQVRSVPFMMAAPMVILALLCVGLALLVITGLGAPLLIAPAADALMEGVFSL